MKKANYIVPAIVVALGAVYFALGMRAPAEAEVNLSDFASLPSQEGGRIQPMDSYARNTLMAISNRQEYKDVKGDMQPAIRWLLEAMAGTETAANLQVFRIENLEVLNLLGLKTRPLFWRYSFNEIIGKDKGTETKREKAEPEKTNQAKLLYEAKRAQRIEPKDRDVFDVKILDLANRLELYIRVVDQRLPAVIPQGEEWLPLARAQSHPAAQVFGSMLAAYADGSRKDFDEALSVYRTWLTRHYPDEMKMVGFEVFFNRFDPFNRCIYMNLAVFLLAVVGWLAWSRPLNWAAFGLAVLTLLVHTWALWARMYLQGRPPVTNLYSSAVFIGWGSVCVCLALELIYRNGIGNVVASVLGAITLVIAHHLSKSGDTLEMLQAVLDTNFWLATHVTIVTFGYVATFVAGFIGIAFILLGVATPWLNRDWVQVLGKMMYGVICFATLLSFTGTVLGGIWADQSWGRFWGWDPKENGALLIVIWNALILHARWGGMIKQRGMAVLAVLGNVVTAWSWFGVNMLGVGLHSYGFIPAVLFWMLVFIGLQLLFVVAGLLPADWWWSFRTQRSPAKAAL
jgi:ABC-type transport system involved in cytochrome c biogenesis permease subunit